MAGSGGGFLKNNVFLVAAVSLPVVVVAFFLLASAIPRWTVPPPQYDLLIGAARPYRTPPRVAVEFKVRDGQLDVIVQPVPKDRYYEPPRSLYLFDHTAMSLKEIALEIPDSLPEGSEPQTVSVAALAGRRILDQTKAPDGYELQTNRSRSGPGLVGDLFGMHGGYAPNAAIVHNGRVISIPVPSEYQYLSPFDAIGWLTDARQPAP